jgi:hypothetical protein
LLTAVLLSAAGQVRAQEALPQWAQDMKSRNAGLIDSIVAFAPDTSAPEYSSFIIYYHQPLAHANPQGPQFPMRALLTVDNRKDPTKAVNHVYFSGYNIEKDFLSEPNSNMKEETGGMVEIAKRYRANMIQPEHRYFAYSSPDSCWTMLDYCTAAEATEDFHALIAAMKKVFTGKWAISGISKGGITTTIQHAYHPEDADIFVPYSAPFFDTDRDTVMQSYWYNNGWSKEFRELYMNVRRQGVINRKTIYPLFVKMNSGGDTVRSHLDSLYGTYLASVLEFGFQEHANSDTAAIRSQIHENDSILASLNMSYGDTVYAYLMERAEFKLDKFRPWLDSLRKSTTPKATKRRRPIMPIGITEEQWCGDAEIPTTAYHYQANCELGYFDFRFDEVVDKEQAAELNAYWKKHYTCYIKLLFPFFMPFMYSRSLYDYVTTATQNATKPLVFIYGMDDTWTGAAMKDDFINGTNVCKFILPAQNHNVSFSSNTDKAQCDAIRAILDGVLSAPQGMDQINHQSSIINHKIIKDGHLLIEHNGRTYTLTGQELR